MHTLRTHAFFVLPYLLHPLLTTSNPLARRAFSSGPVISTNFPDPTFLTINSSYYAFSTASSGHNIPLATSPDFTTWTAYPHDTLPTLPPWSSGATWAPSVFELSPQEFIMYFTATYTQNPSTHCLGYATASTPTGPYNSTSPQPLICPVDQGGAIDPSIFKDADGTLYLVYKIDGNSLPNGGGGPCGNAAGVHPTPIMLQKLGPDGVTLVGAPMQLLDRGPADGPLIEAPDLILADGTYYLFFSSNCYNGPDYDTSYATAGSVAGPYKKSGRPLLTSSRDGGNSDGGKLFSPGGATVGEVGGRWNMVFHADETAANSGVRQMWTAGLTVGAGKVTVG